VAPTDTLALPVRPPLLRAAAVIVVAGLLMVATVVARGFDPPWFEHAYLIVLENHGSASIVGNPQAPYLNGLIASYGLATDYTAVAHPSQPDYLALVSGSTWDVQDDASHDLSGQTLFDQIEQHGRTWHVYEQDYPGGCFTGAQASGPVDLVGLPGAYVRKHDPAISFTSISGSRARCANITSLASFDAGAADFEMIVPNLANDMHDRSIRQGDEFLAAFVPRILSSAAFAHGALFITWDEGTGSANGGGRVPMIVVRPGMTPGFRSYATHTHRAFPRTVEDAWGLGCLPQTCHVTDLGQFFGR